LLELYTFEVRRSSDEHRKKVAFRKTHLPLRGFRPRSKKQFMYNLAMKLYQKKYFVLVTFVYVLTLVIILLTFKWNDPGRNNIQFGFLYAASGLWSWGFYWGIRKTATKVRLWPSVEGEIISSKVVRRSIVSYQTVVDFRYVVDDKTLVATNVFSSGTKSYFHWLQSKGSSEQRAQRYEPGRKEILHYNLLDPKEAYLIGQPEPNSMTGIFGVLLLLYGLVVILLNLK
jgi:hypothetical protein